ncbi:hypothetical protein [Trichormus azollae]|uniref:hypothetical protein n=1 Tax=Trichormus azollae TaxID=1164 RepID=UPI00325D8A3E
MAIMFSVRVSELNSAISCQFFPSCVLTSFRPLWDDASRTLPERFSDTTVAHGGNPQDHADSPVTCHLLPEPKSYFR